MIFFSTDKKSESYRTLRINPDFPEQTPCLRKVNSSAVLAASNLSDERVSNQLVTVSVKIPHIFNGKEYRGES